jgi:hypothetical protein
MPPLAVMMAGVAPGELGPGLVAGEHVAPRGAKRLALGEDRRNQNGARIAAQRNDNTNAVIASAAKQSRSSVLRTLTFLRRKVEMCGSSFFHEGHRMAFGIGHRCEPHAMR